jgi:hypothetical protein
LERAPPAGVHFLSLQLFSQASFFLQALFHVVIMGSGAAFFMVVEGWSITNSFYFTGITGL